MAKVLPYVSWTFMKGKLDFMKQYGNRLSESNNISSVEVAQAVSPADGAGCFHGSLLLFSLS